jgi:hypothetical protein
MLAGLELCGGEEGGREAPKAHDWDILRFFIQRLVNALDRTELDGILRDLYRWNIYFYLQPVEARSITRKLTYHVPVACRSAVVS